MKKTIFYILFVSVFFQSGIVKAAFVGGIEQFNGTVKDSATWEEYIRVGTITQNDRLEFNIPSNMPSGFINDYTTKDVTVGIGDTVRVKVWYEGTGLPTCCLMLTTNSKGTSNSSNYDDHFIYLAYQRFSEDVSAFWYGGRFGDPLFIPYRYPPDPTSDNPYIFQIERTSSKSAIFSVFDKGMNLIGSLTVNPFIQSGVPDELYISLLAAEWGTEGSTIVFDDVEIIVPEPATFALLAFGGLLIRRKK